MAHKYWINSEKGEDKIIVVNELGIYKANPKPDALDQYIGDAMNNNLPSSMFMIPYTYMKAIRYAEGTGEIEVQFSKDSVEEFIVKDESKIKDIFDSLKEETPNGKYRFENYSKWKAGRKPLIALLVVTIIFVTVLSFAIGLENGNTYGVGIKGRLGLFYLIFLSMASLGVFKVCLIFLSLASLAIFSFIKKASKIKRVHSIFIR